MIYTKENLIYADNYTTYSMIVPLTKNGEYQLTLTDTFGDGLTGDATVYLGEEASVDKVLAYFGGSYEHFSYSYTLDCVVSEDATITGLFPIAAPSPTPPVPSPSQLIQVLHQPPLLVLTRMILSPLIIQSVEETVPGLGTTSFCLATSVKLSTSSLHAR